MLQLKATAPIQTNFLVQRLKIVAGAFIITLFFSLMLLGKVFHEELLIMFILTYLQLEIFIWLGNSFFKTGKVSGVHSKKRVIVRLLAFYIAVLAIAGMFFLGLFYVQYLIQNNGVDSFFTALAQLEMKGFLAALLTGYAISTVFFFYIQWAEALKREHQLAQEKLIFQYETLKAQVNPHFLFNSLNTLSSLVRNNQRLSEEFINKFSGIYRYIIENQEKDVVPLSSELQFVHDYFALQKIRDEEKIDLRIEIKEPEKIKVLPVSLQQLIENAFKHNSATRLKPLEIIIHNEGIDKLVVRNNLQPKTLIGGVSKTGLKNLNERSRLILNREIEVLQTESEYIVKIPVKVIL